VVEIVGAAVGFPPPPLEAFPPPHPHIKALDKRIAVSPAAPARIATSEKVSKKTPTTVAYLTARKTLSQ
jgi:hypothetical protein